MKSYCACSILLLLATLHSFSYGQSGYRPAGPGHHVPTLELSDAFHGRGMLEHLASRRPHAPRRAREAAYADLAPRRQPSDATTYRLPGEFEKQRAMVLGCKEMVYQMPELLADIVSETCERLSVILLVNDAAEYRRAQEVLGRRGLRPGCARFVEIKHDTMWCRDYGPLLVEMPNGKAAVIDAHYIHDGRPQDDMVPVELGRRLGLPTVSTSLRLEGGNLLSNGRGVCLTTTRVLDCNDDLGEASVREVIRLVYGGEQTVFLEPLEGEPTGHVDMFATFTAPNVVVVGSYGPDIDPANAEILDRNAERLRQVTTDGGPLVVVRVPMPAHDDAVWRTYTNVVYANGVLLVPVYPDVDSIGQRETLTVFSRLLPDWRVVGIDARQVVMCGGAMHCATMNLGPLHNVPVFPEPSEEGLEAEAGAEASVQELEIPWEVTRVAHRWSGLSDVPDGRDGFEWPHTLTTDLR